MRVAFRVDASLTIGSGHVMRCMTLASALKKLGATVMFISRVLPGHLCDYIASNGFLVMQLRTDTDSSRPQPGATPTFPAHAGWLGVEWTADVCDSRKAIAAFGGPIDWLVVDHYALDSRWESALRADTLRMMVIDDLADRIHDCDLLLDQNLYHDAEVRYAELVPPRSKILLGPRYALLRPEFAEARHALKARNGAVRRILVFFGGVDASNETAKTIGALQELRLSGVEVDVVVGGTNPHHEEIRLLCANTAGFYFHCQASNMAELMAGADLAIGGSGSTCWERCCLGLPTIMLSLADNQTPIAAALAQAGLCQFLGNYRDVDSPAIRMAVEDWIANPARLNAISLGCMELVSGNGTQMVVDEIASSEAWR